MKQEHAWNIFLDNQKLIEIADKKAGYLFVVCSLITSYIIANYSNLIDDISWLKWLIIVLIGANGITFISILLVFYARYAKHTGVSPPKLVYFNDIVQRKFATDYINDFKNATEESILEDVLYQVYETSVICKSKFKILNIAMKIMIFSLMVFFSIILIAMN